MKRPLSIKAVFVILVVCVGYFFTTHHEKNHTSLPDLTQNSSSFQTQSQQPSSDVNQNRPPPSFDHRPIEGSGVVVKILPDDNKSGGINGSRHQRFLLRLSPEQTVLVAHNIDLSPRIDHLRVGRTVEFKGEFINNEKGGVIHWTHHDPKRKHIDGWLKYAGQTYQ